MVKRNPEDPRQLAIAVHELAHAWVWKDHGITVKKIHHSGSSGFVQNAEISDKNWNHAVARRYCIGLWAGFEAEDLWLKTCRQGRASRGASCADISNFTRVARKLEPRLPESEARSLARDAVNHRWSQITSLAPELVCKGSLTI